MGKYIYATISKYRYKCNWKAKKGTKNLTVCYSVYILEHEKRSYTVNVQSFNGLYPPWYTSYVYVKICYKHIYCLEKNIGFMLI